MMLLWKILPAAFTFGLLEVLLRFKDDADLARRLKAREPHAMSDLYDRYGRIAFSLIYRIVRNTAATEESGSGDVSPRLEPRSILRSAAWVLRPVGPNRRP